ncbi:uncharacterized protein LOC107272116 [Cephus cinctus]|uniref:Uncharacterized protein LOC107272116 n=1 Tax=Cephus cinctus TaxID=211228 RepID=A0AAJ7C9D7_CEPCN|nr:uncharacterized protein LOC107272116 [Cephus cinctus]
MENGQPFVKAASCLITSISRAIYSVHPLYQNINVITRGRQSELLIRPFCTLQSRQIIGVNQPCPNAASYYGIQRIFLTTRTASDRNYNLISYSTSHPSLRIIGEDLRAAGCVSKIRRIPRDSTLR